MAEPQKFDLAIGGITITDARREIMDMSEGYLGNGKTILCRTEDATRFQSLADIDKPEVRVMVNPGGLNEKFANENLTHATIIVHPKNEEIPSLKSPKRPTMCKPTADWLLPCSIVLLPTERLVCLCRKGRKTFCKWSTT